MTAHPQGYLYDLWLIERIADELAAYEFGAPPAVCPRSPASVIDEASA